MHPDQDQNPNNLKKDFKKWIEVKSFLHERKLSADFYVQVGEIWWCSIGENVGAEINGKNDRFDRPVLIVRVFNKDHVWIVPLTTRCADDKFHFILSSFYPKSTVALSQIRSISPRRFSRFIMRISHDEMIHLSNALIELLKNETPSTILGARGISTPPLTAGNNITTIASPENNAIANLSEVCHNDVIKMAIIKKKIQPQYFDAVANGKKKYEFRMADFDVKEGDTLILEEWDPQIKKYTGRTIVKKISFVGKFDLDSFGQRKELEEKGFYILSLE